MTTLISTVQSLFSRMLTDAATSFPSYDRVVGFAIPGLPSEQLRQLSGGWPIPQMRWLPSEDFMSEVLQAISAWSEWENVAAHLRQLAILDDLPTSCKEGLVAKIVRATMLAHCESKIAPVSMLGMLGFGVFAADPLVRPLAGPLFDASVLETAATVVAQWESLFATEKMCTIIAPLQGLHLQPETTELPIDDDTALLHISELSLGLVLRLRSEYRSALIRGGDTIYNVVHHYRPAERARLSVGDTTEARELVLRVTAAIRLASPPSWLACPMYMVIANLPWLEPSAEVLNQNLPWGGMSVLAATAENAEAVRHYIQALGGRDFPPLDHRTSTGQDYEYVVWAIKQVAALSTAVDRDIQASHLFMALDSLFGKINNTLGSWQGLTNKLLIPGEYKARRLAKILEETYAWRNRLFHHGITPPSQFFHHHLDELWRLVLATLRWILDNKQCMDLRTKQAFATTVHQCLPQSMRIP